MNEMKGALSRVSAGKGNSSLRLFDVEAEKGASNPATVINTQASMSITRVWVADPGREVRCRRQFENRDRKGGLSPRILKSTPSQDRIS